MEYIYGIAGTSVSSLYGNVSRAIEDLLLEYFPAHYFNYTNIASELSAKNIRRQFGSNTIVEMSKRKKPYLIIKPIYSVTPNDVYMEGTLLTKNWNNYKYGIDKRHLFPVLKDKENGYFLKFKMNRDKIDFDVTVTVSTLHQQIDIYKLIENTIVWEVPHYNVTSLEAIIPRSMIYYMGKLCNIDIMKNAENPIPILLQRLNKLSGYPITYKIRNASGLNEFYMYYRHNMLITFSDLSIDQVNRKNMVDDSYDINFRISVELNLPAVYVLEGISDYPDKIKADLVIREDEKSDMEFIPLFTLNNLYSTFPPELDEYRLYSNSIVQISPKATNEDTVEISELFLPEYQNIIRENVAMENPMQTLMRIYILKNKDTLIEGNDWYIDWPRLTVHIKNPDKYATYRLIIYINNAKFNDRLIELADEKKSDKTH